MLKEIGTCITKKMKGGVVIENEINTIIEKTSEKITNTMIEFEQDIEKKLYK